MRYEVVDSYNFYGIEYKAIKDTITDDLVRISGNALYFQDTDHLRHFCNALNIGAALEDNKVQEDEVAPEIKPKLPTVKFGRVNGYGTYLMSQSGMTLYYLCTDGKWRNRDSYTRDECLFYFLNEEQARTMLEKVGGP